MKKIIIWLALSLSAFTIKAQNGWPSPEVEHMYQNASEKTALGDYKDAIITYRQAIILAPDMVILYKGLAKALYQSGNYSEAEKVLRPVIERPDADEGCYDILAAAQAVQENTKEALYTIKKGLEHFPQSGLLYHDKGHLLELKKKQSAALDAWVDGIHHDPGYPMNYYEAACIDMVSVDVMQGLLYAEIYLNIASDTIGEFAFKSKLFAAWKTMFDDIASGNTGSSTSLNAGNVPGSFIDAVQQTYDALTPVVSDGITTENLTMARTRFLMTWFDKYAGKYPFALFSYHDYLLRNGLFDIYNEWLFGKAENITEYNAWNQFHPGEIALFLEKKQITPLKPEATNTYSDAGMDGNVKKKKR